MRLTAENKVLIDRMSYSGLLSYWRFAPAGDSWFLGPTGRYWEQRMEELRGKLILKEARVPEEIMHIQH